MTARRATVRRAFVSAVAALLVAAGASGCQPARPVDRSKPILLIHGYALGGGTDCGSTFDGMIADLRAQGFSGPFVKVGFLTGDTRCDMTLRDWGSFDNSSSWKLIAKAFSKYVATTYTAKGTTVDVVGYSMGGNIARGAVWGTQKGEAGFTGPLKVEDVVTLGAPHDGAAWFTQLCLWGMCSSLKPGATDIDWLDGNGNPQGAGGTEWTVVGSTADAVVPDESATEMAVPAARKVVYTDVPHTGAANYMHRNDVVLRAGKALAEVGS